MNNRKDNIPLYETLAVGGRYDNVVAHYQPVDIPVAVGVRFFCYKFIQKIHFYEIKKRNDPKHQKSHYLAPLDVYIVSSGVDCAVQDKMELLSDFWKAGIRAEADFSNNFDQQ